MEKRRFAGWYLPDFREYGSCERIVYVGCVHEAERVFLERLRALGGDPPNVLIFCGDVTGSQPLEVLKTLFYNHVYNQARGELGIGTPKEQVLSDAELLEFVGRAPPYLSFKLREGYRELINLQFQLEGDNPQEAEDRVKRIADAEIANGIRQIARGFSFLGPWVRTLSESVRRELVRGFQENARQIVSAIKGLRSAGTKVIVVGGNWDNSAETARNMTGENVPVFDPVSYCRAAGIDFFERLGFWETDHSLHIFVPFWELYTPSTGFEFALQGIVGVVGGARAKGKAIIAVAHSEPSTVVHNLTAMDPWVPLSDERKKPVVALCSVLAAIQPDEVVYAHQHGQRIDHEGKKVDVNAKYVLDASNPRELVCNPADFGRKQQILASYIPLRHLAESRIPDNHSCQLCLFGGKRDPVRIL